MNKKESLALFRQGRAAWNTWAEKRLAERRKLKEAGDWIEDSDPDKQNDATRAWHKATTADFSGHTFNSVADFSGFVFPGPALFREAAFSGKAEFRAAAFSGKAEFRAAAFSSNAEFSEANFSKIASFVQTDFTGFTSFDRCRFEECANYHAIKVSRSFSLSQAWFRQVPDFTQARFAESLKLYATHIEPQRVWPRSLADFKTLLKGNINLAARWRALKRLAVAAHDHDRELLFWKGEVLARRWSVDKPWHALFYCGLFYGWLSDFGRSVVRPLIGWALGLLGFTGYYLSQHLGDDWLCGAGPGNTLTAALGLSLRNALVLPGSGSATRLDQIYACLYGIHGDGAMTPAPLPARFQPVIPDAIAFAGVLQNLWSAVMLFLLFLALRNHFKIK